MQQLHLVGFTTDLEGLIFSARRGAKSGSFVVPLDEKLVATIAEAHRRRNGESGDAGPLDAAGGKERPSRPPRPDSRLNPREIQGRLRAGRTIEEVAREANVDTEWVERWAAPVMAEQQKVVARARGLVFSKARGGPSVEPLARSVAWNVADKGVWLPPEQFDRAWSAYQSLDTWIVRFRYRSRGRDHVAEWELDGEELVALDRIASQLAYLDRARRRKSPPRAEITEAPEPTVGLIDAAVSVADEEEETPAPARRAARKAKNSGGRATAKKRAGSKTAAKKSTARKSTARKSTAKKSTARKAAKKAVARRAPARKAATGKKAAATKRAARTTAAKSSARRPAKKGAVKKGAVKKGAAKKATVARKATRKAAGARKATRKSSGGRRPSGTRPPAATPGIARESRARLAASDMLSTEPDLLDAPRFGTPGNPPARRSGAGGKRTVVRARGRKKAASPADAEPLADAPVVIEPAPEPEAADVEELEADDAAWQRAAQAGAQPAAARRGGRRPPRLRATVRRRERDEPDASSDADEEPAVVAVARPAKSRSRAQIAADRAGDLVGEGDDSGDAEAAIGSRETLDAGQVFVDDVAADPSAADEAAPERRRRRRRLLRR